MILRRGYYMDLTNEMIEAARKLGEGAIVADYIDGYAQTIETFRGDHPYWWNYHTKSWVKTNKPLKQE